MPTARCASAWTTEIFVDPRVIDRQQFLDRAYGDNFPVGNNGNPIADGI
jgi:hypothetical protein